MAKIAVLTGDLVRSTKVSSPKNFMHRLEHLLAMIEAKYHAKTVIFRGDGFQITLNPHSALECALLLRAGLIASSPLKKDRWDARIAIAIAAAASEQNIYGDAYIESGRGLDTMVKESFYFFIEPEICRKSIALATRFVDDVIHHWTPSEAEAYFWHLQQPGGHKQIAEQLHKSRATVTKTLLRAKYSLIDQYLQDAATIMDLAHAR